MTKIDFEKEAQKEREKNQLKLKKDIFQLEKNSDLKLKIENYSKRYNLSINYVIDKLKNSEDDMLFNGFEKDPAKQNIYEILQLEYIRKIADETGIIHDVNKLKSGGKNAKYIKDGKILGNLSKKERGDLKSLDFYRCYEFLGKKLEFFTTCKYTKDEGGAQDNQANDVYSSYMESVNLKDNDKFFIALVDGDYYHKISWNNLTYIDFLNSIFSYKRCIATDCDGLFNIIQTEIIRWLQSFNTENVIPEIDRIKRIKFD